MVTVAQCEQKIEDLERRIAVLQIELKRFKEEALVLTRSELEELLEYSCSLPTGTTIGKKWRRDNNEPLRYHRNNVGGSLNLLDTMARRGVHRLVFSSSCTVYGAPEQVPISESHPLRAINPYGRTKLIIEDVCRDLAAGDPRWRIALLRYFNPVGAHPSGAIGEDPRGIPNNLMPYVMQVAVGRLPRVRVFGNDYPTRDGTGIRDYLHVVDLATGHLRALDGLDALDGCEAVNLGTGRGHSVLEVIRAVEAASGRSVAWEFAPRREGDSAEAWADPARARALWGWRAERSLPDMCADSWRFAQANPAGYGVPT